ncbi:hypothetical protein NDU88_004842 [Pleurodeles waltl]|uniref:Uncharacterized protein n=1 Tax=Pleurodeles waltl TaxID=8319 RepID=A0AAV7LJJ0_PLEWA|nr:hypothetical protein NDU88_004842 [Pleurodeles waltl]
MNCATVHNYDLSNLPAVFTTILSEKSLELMPELLSALGAVKQVSPGVPEMADLHMISIHASQDAITRALLWQSSKMELQIDLLQSLALRLAELSTKMDLSEGKIQGRSEGRLCSCVPIIDNVASLLEVLTELVTSVRCMTDTPVDNRCPVHSY